MIKAWKDATGLTIYEGYGQTETVLCVGTFPGMQPKFGSMGKPSPGWRIELHDDHGKPVGVHEEGRIAIHVNPRPVGMFREYLNNPEENRKSFVGDWYCTGDKAYKDEDGYFWFIGRDDDVMKSPATGSGRLKWKVPSWSILLYRRQRLSVPRMISVVLWSRHSLSSNLISSIPRPLCGRSRTMSRKYCAVQVFLQD